ncbi:epidermal patterning factor-like protein 8 [Phtheirospermum japonicum]|uniref:Epidermal patterning factor-like protein n=1 Tax=Phtheirospermum japonicum TaxID=374723 RepID=A0A830D3Z8_9LAMI|nr:epidermal patterning factor-like protein 8 [Phtheirospermum japonicum]
MILGSRPPGCVNKCLNCRPCKATLVIPPHKSSSHDREDDDTYYLLSWKCRCGNKLYQP